LRSRASSRSFCIACGSTEPSSTGRRRRLLPSEGITSSCQTAGKDVPAGTMAMVSSSDFLRAPERPTAIATLNRQRHLTPSCGGLTPTAERTVGPARISLESLTPRPGIREQYRHETDLPGRPGDVRSQGYTGRAVQAGTLPTLTRNEPPAMPC
jgi:hypothetical protein